MNLSLFFDTETTGLPLWKEPSEHPEQPHLVELGALVVDDDTREVVHSLSLIIRPDGWEIPAEVEAVHGISHARALAVGVPEAFALDALLELHGRCQRRIAFNKTFDERIVRIGIKRYYGTEAEPVAEAFKAHPSECAMRLAHKVMGGKFPKLAEAYTHFTGEVLEQAHSAYADAEATARLFWRVQAELSAAPAA